MITLNALTASQAANDFLFYMTGMTSPGAFDGYLQAPSTGPQGQIRAATPRRRLPGLRKLDRQPALRAEDEALVPLVD